MSAVPVPDPEGEEKRQRIILEGDLATALADGEHARVILSEIYQLVCLGDGRRERFFHQHVLTGPCRSHHLINVYIVHRTHVHRLHLGIPVDL